MYLTKSFSNRVPKDEVYLSQLWSARCDVTYSPIANKIANLLTNQAGGVMAACNSLLDRFYGVVLSRLYPEIDSNELPSHRRYCSLSIFTAGSPKSCSDGFANSPHIDRKDIFEQNFQNEARLLLEELRTRYSNDLPVIRDLEYLERMSKFDTGFCVPTTCGYSIIDYGAQKIVKDMDYIGQRDIERRVIRNVTDFAMIGLGVSVSIHPKSYHYFMASLFTHCTPVPIQYDSSGYTSLYSKSYNIVGWGGGKAETNNTYRRRRSRRLRRNKRKRSV
jgi:hypothetical protein